MSHTHDVRTIHVAPQNAYDEDEHDFFMTAPVGAARTEAWKFFGANRLTTTVIVDADEPVTDERGMVTRRVKVIKTTTAHYGSKPQQYADPQRAYVTRRHSAAYDYTSRADGTPYGMSTVLTVGEDNERTLGVVPDVARFNRRQFEAAHFAHIEGA